MGSPAVPVGFDYAEALKSIATQMTYVVIADYIGYESSSSVERVIAGAIPPHPQGEAIWALFREIFGDKPPTSSEQDVGGSGLPV